MSLEKFLWATTLKKKTEKTRYLANRMEKPSYEKENMMIYTEREHKKI